MNTEEQARKLRVQERQHDEQVQENMLSRAVAEVETHSVSETDVKARELLVQERQHDEQVQGTMLRRAVEEMQ
jgi:hypothetical protein